MRNESNRKPEPIEIRKLGVIDDAPLIYLYLNDNIKHETRLDMDDEETVMHTYDSTQITTPIPASLLPEIDTTLIARHDTNQTTVKQKTVKHMKEIKTSLKEATKHNVKNVDRLDKLTPITEADLEKIRKQVEQETKQL